MVDITTLGAIELATLALATGSALVGLFIAALALRGLRRHKSRQMLFLSVGMLLLFGAAYLVALVGTALLQLRILTLPQQNVIRLTVRILQFFGLVAIAYSLVIGE